MDAHAAAIGVDDTKTWTHQIVVGLGSLDLEQEVLLRLIVNRDPGVWVFTVSMLAEADVTGWLHCDKLGPFWLSWGLALPWYS